MHRASNAGTCCTAAWTYWLPMERRGRVRSLSGIAASSSSAGTRRHRRLRRSCRSKTCLVLVTLLLMAAAGCEHETPVTQSKAGGQAAQLASFTRTLAPEEQRPGQLCSDFGETRVCYEGLVARRVPRSLPEGLVPTAGFRCGGSGAARECEDRAQNGGPFDCGTTRCLQLSPRMPDDGEWECVEISGLVFCHSRGPMAGAARGPRDLGWLCGARRGHAEQICIDTDPDRPDDQRFRACRYEQRLGASIRSCSASRAPLVGDACSAESKCPKDSTCQDGWCLPRRPEPACWLDGDCGADSRCALGSCVSGGA